MKKYFIIISTFIFVLLYYNRAIAQENTAYLYDNPSAGLVTIPYGAGTIPPWYANLQKYWYYRYRLVNDFTLIGANAGESLPATKRHRGDDDGDWGDIDRFYGSSLNLRHTLDWNTDNTIDLGNYLSTLATEYRVLKDFNFPTNRTIYEMQYAQNALNRLCNNSYAYEYDHTLYPGSSSSLCTVCPSMDVGYPLRDDVPFLTFVDPVVNPLNYRHFNRPGLYRSDNMFVVEKGAGAFRSSYYGSNQGSSTALPTIAPPGGTGWHNPANESQDQLIPLFIGEALTLKYLNGGTDPGVPTLVSQSQTGIYQLIKWPYFLGSFYPPYWSVPDVVNPTLCANNNCSSDGIIVPSADAMLDAAYGLLYGTAANPTYVSSIGFIRADIRFNPLWAIPYAVAFQNEAWWNPSCDDHFPDKTDISYTDGYVAFANDWAVSSNPDWDWLAPIRWVDYSNYIAQNHHDTWSWTTLTHHSESNAFGEPHIPLIYELNYGYRNWDRNVWVSHILDIAPPCGPWNNAYSDQDLTACFCALYGGDKTDLTGLAFPPTDVIAPDVSPLSEWGGNDALWDPTHRPGYPCYWSASSNVDASEYNGLDYMQLFNLYSLERKQAYDGAHISLPYLNGMINPYYCENYDVNYPDNVGYGSSTHKLHLNWLEYISAIDKIHASGNGWVEFRGAKVIDLNPHFEAEYGSFFNGYIQDYNCHGAENNDASYNFATVDITGPSYRVMHEGKDTIWDTKQMPVAYFPKGMGNFPEKTNVNISDGYEDEHEMDSLYNDAAFANQMRNLLTQYLFNSTTDTNLLDAFKERYGWNDDSIAKYKINQDNIIINLSPNPTNDNAYLSYSITNNYVVKISLSNMLGQDFSDLIDHYDENQIPGSYKIMLNTKKLTPGMYIVKIAIGNQLFSKKLSVLSY